MRASLARLFDSVGLEALTFADAEAFLQSEFALTAGVVLLDFAMPGLSGLETLRILRQRGSRLPAIILTAHADPSLRERATQLGVVGFHAKPFVPSELLQSVDRVLNPR